MQPGQVASVPMGETPRTTACLAGALTLARGLTLVPRKSRTKSRGGWAEEGEKDLRWRQTGPVKSGTWSEFTFGNAG